MDEKATKPRVRLLCVGSYLVPHVEFAGRRVPFPTWDEAMDWANRLALMPPAPQPVRPRGRRAARMADQ